MSAVCLRPAVTTGFLAERHGMGRSTFASWSTKMNTENGMSGYPMKGAGGTMKLTEGIENGIASVGK